jgi:uncharacterized repeat protein (TIGR03803 family)
MYCRGVYITASYGFARCADSARSRRFFLIPAPKGQRQRIGVKDEAPALISGTAERIIKMNSLKFVWLGVVLSSQTILAQTFTTLVSFDLTNGSAPEGSFAQGFSGDLYATTIAGGANEEGIFFAMTPGGYLSTLYNFSGAGDGGQPMAAPLLATDGEFYGTTYSGGTNLAGVIYQLSPAGEFATLYSFCRLGNCADGKFPTSGLEPLLVAATNAALWAIAWASNRKAYPENYRRPAANTTRLPLSGITSPRT